MLEIKKNFSQRELLWFGPLFALFIGIIASILIRRFQMTQAAVVLAVLAAIVIAVYYLVPAWRKPIYLSWMYSVAPIGLIVSHILLALIFYGLLTPIGLALRMFGYDPLHRAFDKSAATYWVPRAEPSDTQRYFRQF